MLFVVAADEGWSRQSGEHLAALDALGVAHGIVVVTKIDRADPARAAAEATGELAATSLAGAPVTAVSAHTGAGLADLRVAISDLAGRLPAPQPPVRQRIWIDRAFTITGTGTVVTGTLGAGRIDRDDVFELNGERVSVRALESLGSPHSSVVGTARVAIALRGVGKTGITRGDALLSPGAWENTSLIEVRLTKPVDVQALPRQLVLHVGTAAVPVTQRALSQTHLRLTLTTPLPLAVGDRALLRDPGAQHVTSGIVVVDTDPPAFTRRGDAARRSGELTARGDALDPVTEIGRRPFLTVGELARLGLDPASLPTGVTTVDGLLVTTAALAELSADLIRAVDEAPSGVLAETLRERLGLPTPAALRSLVSANPELRVTAAGRVTKGDSGVPAGLVEVAGLLKKRWAADPLDAPTAEELRDLRLDAKALGTLQSLDLLIRLSDAVAVGPGAVEAAVAVLGTLDQPFTASEARAALGSSRRVVLPLLGYLDSHRATVRDPDDRRRLR